MAGEKVPNPYLAAVKQSRAGSVPAVTTLKAALDKAVAAMDGGAWSGGTADAFYSELTTHRTTIRTAGQGGLDTFDASIANQPEMVEPDSWYVHWRRTTGAF